MRTDEELLRLLTEGSEAAFDELFERHRGSVRRKLMRILRSEAVADDLVQEVFLRLWTKADQHDGRGSVGGWLKRIATNLALNEIRSRRRRRLTPLEPPAADDEEDTPAPGWMVDQASLPPEQLAGLAEQHRLLQEAVDALPADKQDLFRMVHEQEMELRAAAEELGIPLGTAKSRLHYTRRLLAERWPGVEREGDER